MDCVPLWVSAARLEERAGNPAKARALLEQARLKNPKTPALWLAAVRAEMRGGNQKAGEALMAKALQDCPDSGELWAETINMAPRPQRKSRSGVGRCRAGHGKGVIDRQLPAGMPEQCTHAQPCQPALAHHHACPPLPLPAVDALKKCNDDPHVVAAVAGLFWSDRKVDKARSWLNRAVTLNPGARRGAGGQAEEAAERQRQWQRRRHGGWDAGAQSGSAGVCECEVASSASNPNPCSTLAQPPPCLPTAADVGDFWAAYYKFEGQFGGAEGQEGVLRRFLAAEPHHGERWQRAAKDPGAARAKPEALLKKVAAELDKDL